MKNINKNFEDSISDAMNNETSKLYNSSGNSDDVTNMNILKSKMEDQIVGEEEESDGETKEATSSGSSGAFSSPMFMKNNLFQPNTKSKLTKKIPTVREEGKPHKEETKEATTSSSVGAYDVPFGSPKKNPLSIEKSVDSAYKKLRSVKDPKFPKYGGNGGKYVKVKDKCKTFPYCNQGDINALEFFENETIKEAIKNVSKKYNISDINIKYFILESMNIYNKKQNKMEKDIEKLIDNIVDKVLSEEMDKKNSKIIESIRKEIDETEQEIDEMEEFYEIAKKRKQERMEAKKAKPDFLDLDGDGDKEESMKKASKDKKETKDKKKKKSIKLSEEEIIDLIEKIVKEEKVEGVKQQTDSMKQSKKINDEHVKEVIEKVKKHVKDGSMSEFKESNDEFPKGNGEMKEMDKKAFQTSEESDEFIETYAYPGMLEVDYDIQPDDERMEMYIKGDSKTGNAEIGEDGKPNGNVVPNKELGEKMMKKYKDGKYQENKENISYMRQPQPVINKPFDDASDKKVTPNKVTKKSKTNEEINRIKNLFDYNYNTQ